MNVNAIKKISVIATSSYLRPLYVSMISNLSVQPGGKFSQLTRDDSVVTKEKVFVNGGFRIIDKHTLTKAMGQEKISVDGVQEPIVQAQIIILATDGFYEARKASFNWIMEQFETSADFEENFKLTIDKLEVLRGDDFTVVMIKKK